MEMRNLRRAVPFENFLPSAQRSSALFTALASRKVRYARCSLESSRLWEMFFLLRKVSKSYQKSEPRCATMITFNNDLQHLICPEIYNALINTYTKFKIKTRRR